ncbi:MAG: RDD family protein [Oceanospirillales bacterium]|uniref:Putative RDD family membrane protein YckC n=1 Tax=Marinobacterium halophilum TaxID=267374 RepID=A0A2P8EXF2_9GAMM|nr:RDD family protein [Marinobacterium halophilum]MBR9829344.1 RDD family protein [Oceanospirillales bacterium]PSL14142.1 putative RDD family membrane protein YckC [Marinobacterium halophilum]
MQASRLLDNHCSVETPEGIDFTQAMAGPVVRILAFLIDMVWRGLVYALIGILSGFLGGFGMGLYLIIGFLLEWFYPVFFEVFRQGQTPGKKAMGLRVVNEDFTPVGWGASVIRNLLRAADFFPLMYVSGLLSMVLSRRFQRLGDLAAGTLVVHVDRQSAPQLDVSIKPRMPQQALTRAERQGIISLTVRSRTISEPRQQELAELLAPVTGVTGEAGLERLKGMGAWLLGRK